MALFNRVTIVGLGLIGGSLGMAIRRQRAARVVGYSRRARTLRAAKRRGAVDVGTTDLGAAVRGAELVILATPVDAIVPLAKRLARFCRRGVVLTDVGSTKGSIVRQLERSLPQHVAFVGGHPLAGSEQRGIEAARSDLFRDSLCVLTRTPHTNARALRTVARFWKPLVRRVVIMRPQQHDRLLAATSHVPHLLAYCLAGLPSRDGLSVAPRSFLEVTRIAKSDPDLWDDIFLSNRAALREAMDRFERRWRALRSCLARPNRARLLRLLRRAHRQRHAIQDA